MAMFSALKSLNGTPPVDNLSSVSFPGSVPKIRSDFVRSMVVRPRRIGVWLDSLSETDPRDKGQQMHQALYAQNRVALNVENRLSIMELYCDSVMQVTEMLQNSYERAPLPLSDRNRSLASFVNRIYSEMANGYKIVAKDLIANGKFQSGLSDVILSMHRATYYLGQMLINAYIVYLPSPEGVWSELHKLYRFAEQYNLKNLPTTMDALGLQDDMVTISDTYLELVMLATSDPYSLMQGDCKQLHSMLRNWVATIEIHRKTPKEPDFGHFVVSLESDLPPVSMGKVTDIGTNPALRFINGFDAIKEVHAVMKRPEDTQMETVTISNEFSALDTGHTELLRRVGRIWSGTGIRRQSTRTENPSEISICIGVNAIHYFVSGEQQFKSPESGEKSGISKVKKSDDLATGDKPRNHDEAFIDLADRPNGSGEIEPRSVGSLAQKPEINDDFQDWRELHNYRMQSCSAVDQSAGGLRVFIGEESEARVKPGDLLGIKFSISVDMQVGVVRSLRYSEEGVLELGAELLSPSPIPIAVRSTPQNGDQGLPYFQGLLLPGNRRLQQPQTMVIPVGTYQSGQNLSVALADGSVKEIVPRRWLECAATFDQLVTLSQVPAKDVSAA